MEQTVDIISSCLDNLPLAMAYVPMQRYQDLYDPQAGLDRGTIFKQLDKPFHGKLEVPNG